MTMVSSVKFGSLSWPLESQVKALEGADDTGAGAVGAGDARDDEGGVLLELMVTPEAARLEAKLGGKAEESLDTDADELDLKLEDDAGVIVTPLVDLPAKMALVSMTVTLSRSALDFAADEAKACNCLGSSMVTT